MKSFRKYISESSQSYHYIIKTIHDLDDAQINTVVSHLKKYDLIYVGAKEKQNDPYTFMDNLNKIVFSIDVEVGMPVSSYVLMQELHSALNLAEKDIVVRGAGEPALVASQDSLFRAKANADAEKDGLVARSRLSTDRFYDDAEQPPTEDVYGNAYNKKLLGYLANVAATRPSYEVEPSAPLFSWIKMKDAKGSSDLNTDQDTSDFNKHIDTPKPIYVKSDMIDEDPINPSYTGAMGNFDDGVTRDIALYKNEKTGDKVTAIMPRISSKHRGKK